MKVAQTHIENVGHDDFLWWKIMEYWGSIEKKKTYTLLIQDPKGQETPREKKHLNDSFSEHKVHFHLFEVLHF